MRARILGTLEAKSTQMVLTGVVAFVLALLMLELLSFCHIPDADVLAVNPNYSCFDTTAHSIVTVILAGFTVSTVVLDRAILRARIEYTAPAQPPAARMTGCRPAWLPGCPPPCLSGCLAGPRAPPAGRGAAALLRPAPRRARASRADAERAAAGGPKRICASALRHGPGRQVGVPPLSDTPFAPGLPLQSRGK